MINKEKKNAQAGGHAILKKDSLGPGYVYQAVVCEHKKTSIATVPALRKET